MHKIKLVEIRFGINCCKTSSYCDFHQILKKFYIRKLLESIFFCLVFKFQSLKIDWKWEKAIEKRSSWKAGSFSWGSLVSRSWWGDMTGTTQIKVISSPLSSLSPHVSIISVIIVTEAKAGLDKEDEVSGVSLPYLRRPTRSKPRPHSSTRRLQQSLSETQDRRLKRNWPSYS